MRPVSVLIATLTLLGALSRPAQAEQASSDSEKLDTLMNITKDIHRTVKNDPLKGKTFGVEFNILRVLLLTEQTSISGGFSLFNINRQAELSFPFFYSRSETSGLDGTWADSLSRVDFTEFTQDVHFRYFLGNTQNGFYLSGFARGALLNGIKGKTAFDTFDTSATANNSNARATEGKLGVGVGLGYRIFSYRGLYWGASLNLGRYIIGKNDYFRGGFLDYDNDAELIFDVELLKFGWAF